MMSDKPDCKKPMMSRLGKETPDIKKHILIGCTGSVATIKLPLLVQMLNESTNGNVEIRVVVTEHAQIFFQQEDLPDNVRVFCDTDEWTSWKKRGDPVLHIDLAKWADVFVIAPLDANTLAKMALGLCDNLLTCIARAWKFDKPLLFCPAMNTRMWEHPVTSIHVKTLKSWGCLEIPCISKTLMCGDKGTGAMAEASDITDLVLKRI